MPTLIVVDVLSSVELARRSDFGVSTVICRGDHRTWSVERPRGDVNVVLVRRGGFRRRLRGASADLDRTVGYVGMPGEEEGFAHPVGGDVCTSISIVPELWRQLAGDAPRFRTSAVYVDARLDLAHRRLLAAAPGDAEYAGTESLVDLVAGIVRRIVTTTVPDGTTSTGDRALVAAARAAIGDDHPAATGLNSLAAFLEVSPYRLSRAFPRELGVSLTRYRNRVRVARALDRIEAGEPSLATLAADLGFADQAHLTRTVRDHVGYTPAALRALTRRDGAGYPASFVSR